MGRTILYARISTPDQNLEHQKENLWSYATDELGIEPSDIEVLEDESTGTNTDRSGYREMIRQVRAGDVEQVVAREVTRLGRTMREISENIHETVEDHECGLYIQNDNIEVEPGGELSMQDKMLLNVLAWAAELEAKKIRENTIAGLRAAEAAGKWTVRPPYGFTTDKEGYLQPTAEFSNALEAIEAVDELGWSHRKAARHSGVPRRTVPNLLERKELYLTDFEEPDVAASHQG